jgi:hypothetical protein
MDIKFFNGQWLLRSATFSLTYASQEEAQIAMSKLATAQAIVAAVQSLALPADSATDLEAEYFDAGTWVDDDVAALGLTAANLAACITLLQQVAALMAGNATTPAVYRATLNKVRRIAA